MTSKEVRQNNPNEEERANEMQNEASAGENASPVDEMQPTGEVEHFDEIQVIDVDETAQPSRNRNLMMWGVVAALAVASAFALFLFLRSSKTDSQKQVNIEVAPAANSNTGETAAPDEKSAESSEIALPPDVLARAEIQYAGVTQRPAVALLNVTGAVETNPQQTQAVTLLVGGRVERVNVAVGDRVGAGAILAVIASPQIVELRGNLQAAQTRLDLAERNLARVKRAENRVAVLQAKAKLDEAQATLNRTRRLIELGAGAGKDLISAEAAYKSAKADFDFQSNIALNREVQETQSAVETARAEVAQIRNSLNALGATGDGGTGGSTALITVRAPASGIVTERLVNAGAGVDAGKPLFTIANLSTVWVIANVPEANIGQVHQGTYAEIRATALGSGVLTGRVSYIDPQLNETTRTARVRVEVQNPGERLKAGMFVEVGFQAGTSAASGEELVVPTEAIQRIGDRTIVFIPQENEPGRFETRDVQIGGETNGYTRVTSGLELGEQVVTRGGFALKSQLMKGSIGDDDK
jgi:cobalt-zinc-cadmium efflux system membrane fusion protein